MEQNKKIIHYCWFGHNPMPKKIVKCIDSWKKHMPDFEIIEWNEKNFDYKKYIYTEQAYNEKKFAFVSDIARLEALYNYGGFYLDTDVMVYKSFETLLDYDCIFGFEEKNNIATSFMGAKKNSKIIKEFLELYKDLYFVKDGVCDLEPNVVKLTKILIKNGAKCNGKTQKKLKNFVIFSQYYFSPYDYINCYGKKNKDTYCEHLFYAS